MVEGGIEHCKEEFALVLGKDRPNCGQNIFFSSLVSLSVCRQTEYIPPFTYFSGFFTTFPLSAQVVDEELAEDPNAPARSSGPRCARHGDKYG